MRCTKDEEIMIQDALHSWWDEYPDDELDNDHQSGPDNDDSFNYDFHEPYGWDGSRSAVKTEIDDYYNRDFYVRYLYNDLYEIIYL